MTQGTRLVDDGIFCESEGRLRLRGARCEACGVTTFPVQAACPRCTGQELADVALPARGRLWSWTRQSFRPKSPYRGPEKFAPYGIGYVDLGSVIVESRLDWPEGRRPVIGEDVGFRTVTAWTEDDGVEVLTYAFATEGRV